MPHLLCEKQKKYQGLLAIKLQNWNSFCHLCLSMTCCHTTVFLSNTLTCNVTDISLTTGQSQKLSITQLQSACLEEEDYWNHDYH
jgi:hypothetical protein